MDLRQRSEVWEFCASQMSKQSWMRPYGRNNRVKFKHTMLSGKSRRSGLSVYTKFKKALSTDFNNSSMGCVSWFIIHNADVEHLGL